MFTRPLLLLALCVCLSLAGSVLSTQPVVSSAACTLALHPQRFLPHTEISTWCALAAPLSAAPAPCRAAASAVCGILRLQSGNLTAGASLLAAALALAPHDWVSHSYLGAAGEYAARQMLSSGSSGAGGRERALVTAATHFSAALQLRGAAAPQLPAALLALAQPPAMLYRSAGTVLAWQGLEAEAAAVYAAGVREGFGWVTPLQRPSLPLPLSPPCPTPLLPSSDPRLAPLLQALEAALPALREEYLLATSAPPAPALQRPLQLQLESAGLEATAGWGVHVVAAQGALRDSACALLPRLCALCAAQPLINATATGQVKYSVLSRGAHILPHAGPTVARLRVHCTLWRGWGRGLGLLRVGLASKEWERGQCFAFDESYEHEVVVAGEGEGEGEGEDKGEGGPDAGKRVVLIVDIVNPFLRRLRDVREHGASEAGWQRHGVALTELWRLRSSEAGGSSSGEL
jgi:hypothetical protein